MKVRFNEGDKLYECTQPVEQKIFRMGEQVGWAIMFNVYGVKDSTEVDELLTESGISKLTFCTEDKKEFNISDYSAVTACTIRYSGDTAVAELQLTKPNAAKRRAV